jgi:hypothetical protein
MKTNDKNLVLKTIGKIYEHSAKCKLEPYIFESLNDDLNYLSNYFSMNQKQAFFLSVVFALNHKKGSSVDNEDLVDYFECNPVTFLEFYQDISALVENGVFENRNRFFNIVLNTNFDITLNKSIVHALLHNLPFPEIKLKRDESVYDLFESFNQLFKLRTSDSISTSKLISETRSILKSKSTFEIVKRLKVFEFKTVDYVLYFKLVHEKIHNRDSLDLSGCLEIIFDDIKDRLEYLECCITKKHVLLRNDLVILVEAKFTNDSEIKLTRTSINLLNASDVKIFSNKIQKDNIIVPSAIEKVALVFDEKEMSQILILQKVFQEDYFSKMQNQLKSKGLPIGITVLLYGYPGTGKTEVVKQIAKSTEREIMKVDVSDSKSMWFGESEKKIKQIFTDYNHFAKESSKTPILFFNEADAIISKRKNINSSNVAQTENTIQNILLEEMENFNGILIATTNIVSNLDKAFERRFLYKIFFDKPNMSTRFKIWQAKMPDLASEQLLELANRFEFSGGEINNIVRKREMEQIIHSNQISFPQILSFCQDEKINENEQKIGFNA